MHFLHSFANTSVCDFPVCIGEYIWETVNKRNYLEVSKGFTDD